ncbi:MAG: hypothetical protein IJ581_00425 [Paludibacteraceae bacterium]|nr:hypothetical protein [Paludibacteraceae bacterium]
MRIFTRFLLLISLSLPLLTSCDHRPDEGGSSTDSPTGLSTFIGAFSATGTEMWVNESGTVENEQQSWHIAITNHQALRTNLKSWVKIEGIFGGQDFFNAYGYYDSKYQCIRIPAGIIEPDKDKSFYFTNDNAQTLYLASFMPCFTPNNGYEFYQLADESDEMWLCVQKDGTLRLEASQFASKELGLYANCFTMFYYYANNTSQAPDGNYMSLLRDVTFRRVTSAPERRSPRAVAKPRGISRLNH